MFAFAEAWEQWGGPSSFIILFQRTTCTRTSCNTCTFNFNSTKARTSCNRSSRTTTGAVAAAAAAAASSSM